MAMSENPEFAEFKHHKKKVFKPDYISLIYATT